MENASLFQTNLERAELISVALKGAWLANANLSYAILTDSDLGEVEFYRANLKGITLSASEIPSNTNFDRVSWGNFVLGDEKGGDFYWAEDAYRQLKRWYTEAGIHNIAGEFFYREMIIKMNRFWWGDYKTSTLKDTLHPFNIKELARFMFPRKPFHWAWSALINLLCGYGEKPVRIFASAIAVIFGLAVAYYFWGSFSLSSFWDTLYYSAASFTALGYGQWAPQPTGWARGMGAAEAMIGVFMMALFLVTFTRKMTR